MKKLIAIMALGLAVSLPSLSLASDPNYMGWVPTEPEAKSEVEVKDEIKGGSVEKDFINLKEANPAARPSLARKVDDDRAYTFVFGVRIPVNSGT